MTPSPIASRLPQAGLAAACAAGLLAQHSDTVTDRYVPYIMPQEHGHLSDLRWLEIAHPAGRTLRVEFGPIGGANV